MRIFYGVQGTGNGHLSRARAMARHFSGRNADVSYLFSGRARDDFFSMDVFGDFQLKQGLTFSVNNGKVSYPRTLLKNNLARFLRDILTLDLAAYDVVISDFEPVTAWAARIQGKQLVSIGHQLAFLHDIPVAGGDPLARWVLRNFAPGHINIGLHWHHFQQPVLPPIIHLDPDTPPVIDNKVLVYLPFENQNQLVAVLKRFPAWDFYIYAAGHRQEDAGNIHLRSYSLDGFQYDLKSAGGVICNAGFELPSECLQLGKKLLVKPLLGQMEQESNGRALTQLGLATVVQGITVERLGVWLRLANINTPMHYPDVAETLVDWVLSGCPGNISSLAATLWKDFPVSG
ncbi:MAG TPA: glycosyltransferase family protein [Pseudomonadales bacterium]|nr:glycosyltransferase family protein [Pseudomonadales bacterium]